MKDLFVFLIGFSFVCIFVLVTFVITEICKLDSVNSLLLVFGEFSICCWAFFLANKLLEYYDKKNMSLTKDNPAMVFEKKN